MFLNIKPLTKHVFFLSINVLYFLPHIDVGYMSSL